MTTVPAQKNNQSNKQINVTVEFQGRDRLTLEIETKSGADREIVHAHLSGVGCTELLALMVEWRPQLRGSLDSLPQPNGHGHAAMLLRELLLKAQDRWQPPYQDEEICHCRAVPTVKVDAAIISGCHDINSIKRATSASTSCGTCLPDIEGLLHYRQDGSKRA